MKKSVTFDWNFDMEEAKDKGLVYTAGVNSDGSDGLGYAYWDQHENAWCSGETLEPMPCFTPKAWIKEYVLSPFN